MSETELKIRSRSTDQLSLDSTLLVQTKNIANDNNWGEPERALHCHIIYSYVNRKRAVCSK